MSGVLNSTPFVASTIPLPDSVAATQPPERFEEVDYNTGSLQSEAGQKLWPDLDHYIGLTKVKDDTDVGSKVVRTTVIENSMDLTEESDEQKAEILIDESFQPDVEKKDNQMQIVIPEGVQSLTRQKSTVA